MPENIAFLKAMEDLMFARRESDMFGTTNSDEYDPAVGATGPID
jgi:hypothetical protein